MRRELLYQEIALMSLDAASPHPDIASTRLELWVDYALDGPVLVGSAFVPIGTMVFLLTLLFASDWCQFHLGLGTPLRWLCVVAGVAFALLTAALSRAGLGLNGAGMGSAASPPHNRSASRSSGVC